VDLPSLPLGTVLFRAQFLVVGFVADDVEGDVAAENVGEVRVGKLVEIDLVVGQSFQVGKQLRV